MRPRPVLPVLLLLGVPLPAQDPPPPARPGEQDPVPRTVVTPTLRARPLLDAPSSITVIEAEDLARRAYRTVPQALRDVPGVMVQETGHGQGSPYLRGLTGFRNLALVDGVRLNHSVFRPGPNQYWNTLDPFSLARLEVAKGPSSVLYGSDAMGGTLQALTRGPWLYPADGALHGALTYRWSDAERYDQARAEVGGWLDADTGVLFGLSAKDFGDVHGGREVGTQHETGYDERDLDFKLEHDLDATTRLTVAHQRVDQDDVPRTHRTIFGIDWKGLEPGSDLLRELDQDRRLTYVQLDAHEVDAGWFDGLRAGLSFHEQDELRERIKGSGAAESQGFEVDSLGLFTHLYRGSWTYGFDYYRDEVDSFLRKASGNSAADDIQGPVADDATYDLFGLFVQDELQVSQRLDLIAGARWTYAAAASDRVRDPVTDLQTSVDQDWDALVASLRFVYDLDEQATRLFGGVSQGFRAPNLSDLTRFDSARSDEFEIPAKGLDPEHTTTLELGLRRESPDQAFEAAIFFTDVRDLILRVPTGNTNADGEFEVSKANVGDGELYGLELAGSRRLDDEWTLFAAGTLLDGERATFPTSAPVAVDEPFDRRMPVTVLAGVRWDDPGGELWGEAQLTWADDADDLSTRDRADTSRIPPGGTPGYTVLDLRAGYRASAAWSFTLGLENVFDEDYRVHGSGVNRPGRGLYLGLSFSF